MTTDDFTKAAAMNQFPAHRRLVQEQTIRQEAALRLAVLGVPLDRAVYITKALGHVAAEGVADTIARSGATLGQIAEAIADSGAERGREQALAQEPTDAELDALHDAFVAHSGPGREINEFSESCCTECGYAVGWPGRPLDGGRRAKRHAARAALSAARAARRDEEKQDG